MDEIAHMKEFVGIHVHEYSAFHYLLILQRELFKATKSKPVHELGEIYKQNITWINDLIKTYSDLYKDDTKVEWGNELLDGRSNIKLEACHLYYKHYL